MKTIRRLLAFAAAVALWPAGSAMAQPRSGYLSETKALLSKLQSMGHGYHAQTEWDELFAQLDNLEMRAQGDRDWDTVVEVNVIKAVIYSEMLGDPWKALSLLQDTKRRYRDQILPAVRKVYIREAEVYSKLGDEAAIRRLIQEYKASALYDPQPYAYWGGQGRDVPLTIVRPNERGDRSLSVTAMETYRMRARFAPGHVFPDFEGVDQNGKPVSLNDLRGKVVLLDFWMPTWEPWKREAPNRVALYRSYHSRGFEILGFNVAPVAAISKDFLRAYNIRWPQVTVEQALFRKLGIFGEATSFLIDQDGVIIGRDLKGADLVDAVKRTLGIE